MVKITPDKYISDIEELISTIDKPYTGIYGVPRGGVTIGAIIARTLGIPLLNQPSEGALVVDDLIDSGKTLLQYPNNDTAVLYRKPHSPKTTYSVQEIDGWIEFFYEDTQTDAQNVIVRLLEHIGENPNREGLLDTPKRVLKFYKEFLTPPEFNFTVFDGESYDEMIVQQNIPFFSLCEHHMAPFFGHATVAYIPNEKIVGLSKLARTVEYYARRLQNQERITSQVANRLQEELLPKGVAVMLSARHFCMEMRGVRTHDVSTVTTRLIGAFKEDDKARAEFMGLSQ